MASYKCVKDYVLTYGDNLDSKRTMVQLKKGMCFNCPIPYAGKRFKYRYIYPIKHDAESAESSKKILLVFIIPDLQYANLRLNAWMMEPNELAVVRPADGEMPKLSIGIAAFIFPERAAELFSQNGELVGSEFVALMAGLDEAVKTENLHVLTVFCAHLAKFMAHFYGIDLNCLRSLDLKKVLVLVRRIYEEGPHVIFACNFVKGYRNTPLVRRNLPTSKAILRKMKADAKVYHGNEDDDDEDADDDSVEDDSDSDEEDDDDDAVRRKRDGAHPDDDDDAGFDDYNSHANHVKKKRNSNSNSNNNNDKKQKNDPYDDDDANEYVFDDFGKKIDYGCLTLKVSLANALSIYNHEKRIYDKKHGDANSDFGDDDGDDGGGEPYAKKRTYNDFADEAEEEEAPSVRKTSAVALMDTDGLCYAATDPRKTKLIPPSLLYLGDEVWLAAWLNDYLERMYKVGMHFFATYQDILAEIARSIERMGPVKEFTPDAVLNVVADLIDADEVFVRSKYESTSMTSGVFCRIAFPEATANSGYMTKTHPVTNAPLTLDELCFCGPMYIREKRFVSNLVDLMENNAARIDDLAFALDSNRTVAAESKTNLTLGLPKGELRVPDKSQMHAIAFAARSPISLITGRPGTGKSFTMVMLAYYLRQLYGPRAFFVFASFKNDVVRQMRNNVLTSPMNKGLMTRSNTAFVTCDLLRTRGSVTDGLFPIVEDMFTALKKAAKEDTEKKELDDELGGMKDYSTYPTVVFVDEASMLCDYHFGILDLLNLRHPSSCGLDDVRGLKHLCIFGDHQQLPPLKPGIFFRHMIERMPDFRIRLTTLHRTNADQLLVAFSAVTSKCAQPVLDGANKRAVACAAEGSPSFAVFTSSSFDDDHRQRTHAVMRAFAKKLLELLVEMDRRYVADARTESERDQRKQRLATALSPVYRDTLGLCQVNDLIRYVNMCADNYYFKTNYSEDLMYTWAMHGYAKTKTCPTFFVGQRVVFKVTSKEIGNLYSRGQLGHVFNIYQHATNVCARNPSSSQRPFISSHRDTHSSIAGRACTLEIRDDFGELYHVVAKYDMKNIFATVEPAFFISVHRSQGMGFQNIIYCVAPSFNLATNDVFLTAVTRTIRSCNVIGAKNVITDVIQTVPDEKNSNVPQLLEIQPLLHTPNTAAIADDDDDDDDDDNKSVQSGSGKTLIVAEATAPPKPHEQIREIKRLAAALEESLVVNSMAAHFFAGDDDDSGFF